MPVRCPHCHESYEPRDSSPGVDLQCPACGENWRLVSGATTRSFHGASASTFASDFHDAGDDARPRTVGKFQLVEHVGMGAFGDVWKARDMELDRIVAVKIPRREILSDSEAEYFLREARAAAQLKHPNIVVVHQAGRTGETLFIASDFIDGESLKERLAVRRLATREAIELTVKVADALHHAHEAGVVHRDLKPANIMLDSRSEPHVMDFGLAKRDVGEVTMTMDGRILGTPAYMPPEQARGEAHHVDRRADVYSLGVILFELLTGELPFRGDARMLIVQILTDPPPSPRKLHSRLPRDLETVCLKCLEKDPARRYQTAAEMAEELRRWLEGKPIRSRAVGTVGRTWRWCRRKPVIAALSVVTSILALAVLIGGPILYFAEADARREAEERRDEANDATRRAKTSLAEQAFQSATLAAQRGRWRLSLEKLDDADTAGYPDKVVLSLQRIRALRSVAEFRKWSAEISRLEQSGVPATHRTRFLIVKAEQLRFEAKSPEGLVLITRALTLGLSGPEADYARGMIAKTTPQAATHFGRAVDADPFYHEATATLVATLVLLGRLDEAKGRAEFARRIFPDDPMYPMWLALIAALEQDRPRMDAWLQRIGTQLPERDARFIKETLQTVFSVVKTIVELDLTGNQFANLQLLNAWAKLRQIQDRVRGGAGDAPGFASLASSLIASIPPSLTQSLSGFGEFDLSRMPAIVIGRDKQFNDGLHKLTTVHPEGTFFWLNAAMLVRQQKYEAAADALVRAAEAPAIIPGIKPQSMFLASTALYVDWLKTRSDKAKIRRAVELARRRMTMGPVKPEFAEILFNVAFAGKDKELSRQIVAHVRQRFPNDLTWLTNDMATEFAGGNYLRAIQLANSILEQNPNDESALTARRVAAERIAEIVRRFPTKKKSTRGPVEAKRPQRRSSKGRP